MDGLNERYVISHKQLEHRSKRSAVEITDHIKSHFKVGVKLFYSQMNIGSDVMTYLSYDSNVGDLGRTASDEKESKKRRFTNPKINEGARRFIQR